MAERNLYSSHTYFLFSKERFTIPNESSSFKNIALYEKDADN